MSKDEAKWCITQEQGRKLSDPDSSSEIEREVEKLFELMDTNHDDMISWPEYLDTQSKTNTRYASQRRKSSNASRKQLQPHRHQSTMLKSTVQQCKERRRAVVAASKLSGCNFATRVFDSTHAVVDPMFETARDWAESAVTTGATKGPVCDGSEADCTL